MEEKPKGIRIRDYYIDEDITYKDLGLFEEAVKYIADRGNEPIQISELRKLFPSKMFSNQSEKIHQKILDVNKHRSPESIKEIHAKLKEQNDIREPIFLKELIERKNNKEKIKEEQE